MHCPALLAVPLALLLLPVAAAAPNQSAALNELVAPAPCSSVHLTSPNLWPLQRGFFYALHVRVSIGRCVSG